MATHHFDDETEKQFMREDSEAWKAICTILMGIITIGLLLAGLALWLAL
ncbi:MAG: hypothetical protein KDA60_00970 [Planctomycetales bacterium]|nr:hypothetical protein [Planctomycetales bacterium]